MCSSHYCTIASSPLGPTASEDNISISSIQSPRKAHRKGLQSHETAPDRMAWIVEILHFSSSQSLSQSPLPAPPSSSQSPSFFVAIIRRSRSVGASGRPSRRFSPSAKTCMRSCSWEAWELGGVLQRLVWVVVGGVFLSLSLSQSSEPTTPARIPHRMCGATVCNLYGLGWGP